MFLHQAVNIMQGFHIAKETFLMASEISLSPPGGPLDCLKAAFSGLIMQAAVLAIAQAHGLPMQVSFPCVSLHHSC